MCVPFFDWLYARNFHRAVSGGLFSMASEQIFDREECFLQRIAQVMPLDLPGQFGVKIESAPAIPKERYGADFA
jgi:hypothetical protein